MRYLPGIHEPDQQAAALWGDKPGTVVFTEAIGSNPNDKSGGDYRWWSERGFRVLVRLNNGYYPDGTIPAPSLYGSFATRCAEFVRASQGCHSWIIGNEPNHAQERPNDQPIRATDYARCFSLCREAIKRVNSNHQVIVAAVAPWDQTSGDWLAYWRIMLDAIAGKGSADGISLHAYTHGSDPNLIVSEHKVNDWHWHFRVYRDQLVAVPESMQGLPVDITECNQGDDAWVDANTGWVQAAMREIDAWNKTPGAQSIRSVVLYRWPHFDKWGFKNNAGVQDDFREACKLGFVAPEGGGQVQPQGDALQTFLPSVSTGREKSQQPATMPPREWDERLTSRGVTVETPSLAPGTAYWRVVKARWFSEPEAGGRRHIYVEALNEDGRPLVDIPFEVSWPSGVTSGRTNGRTGFDAGNFPMSPSLNEFSVRIADGTPSELVEGIGMGADGNPGIHTATLLTFQLVTMPAVHQPALPTEQPAPAVPLPAGILDPLMLEAIVLTESAGSGYGEDGRLKIRLEAHLLLTERWGNPAVFQPYFRFDPDNILHAEFRRTPTDPWVMFHNSQALEWQAFEFACSLDEGAALRCISMGAGQVMGFNHARVGYATPRLMFDAFQRSELAQALAVVNYCLADANLVNAIRQTDIATIIRLYNGVGMEAIYRPRLEGHYRRLGGVL